MTEFNQSEEEGAHIHRGVSTFGTSVPEGLGSNEESYKSGGGDLETKTGGM